MLEAGREEYLRPLARHDGRSRIWTASSPRGAQRPEAGGARHRDHHQLRRGRLAQPRDHATQDFLKGRLRPMLTSWSGRLNQTAHPKDRSGNSRRQFARGAAGAVAGAGIVAGLAACENTTTPVGADTGGPTNRPRRRGLVVQKPTGPAGLPLPRPDNAVTWAVTDDNKPAGEGQQPRARPAAPLQLRRLRRPRHDQEVPEAVLYEGRDHHLQLGQDDEAIAKLASGSGRLSALTSWGSPGPTSSS